MAAGKSRGAPYALAHINCDTGPDRPIIRVKAPTRKHEPSPKVTHADGKSSFQAWKEKKERAKKNRYVFERLIEDPGRKINFDEID